MWIHAPSLLKIPKRQRHDAPSLAAIPPDKLLSAEDADAVIAFTEECFVTLIIL